MDGGFWRNCMSEDPTLTPSLFSRPAVNPTGERLTMSARGRRDDPLLPLSAPSRQSEPKQEAARPADLLMLACPSPVRSLQSNLSSFTRTFLPSTHRQISAQQWSIYLFSLWSDLPFISRVARACWIGNPFTGSPSADLICLHGTHTVMVMQSYRVYLPRSFLPIGIWLRWNRGTHLNEMALLAASSGPFFCTYTQLDPL